MRKLFLALLSLALTSSVGAQSCCDRDTANPPAFTWSAKPTCNTTATGRQIRITDVGPNDWLAVCDGSNSFWAPVSGRVVLANVSAAAHTGTASETIVGGTVTVPAGFLGANGGIEIYLQFSTITNNSNAKTVRIRWGASSGASCTSNSAWTVSDNPASTASLSARTFIQNANSQTAQLQFGGAMRSPFGVSGTASTAGTVDTSSTSYLCTTITLANTGDSITPAQISYYAAPAP